MGQRNRRTRWAKTLWAADRRDRGCKPVPHPVLEYAWISTTPWGGVHAMSNPRGAAPLYGGAIQRFLCRDSASSTADQPARLSEFSGLGQMAEATLSWTSTHTESHGWWGHGSQPRSYARLQRFAHSGRRFCSSYFQRAKFDFRMVETSDLAARGENRRLSSSPARPTPATKVRAPPEPIPTPSGKCDPVVDCDKIPGFFLAVNGCRRCQNIMGSGSPFRRKGRPRYYDGQNGLGAQIRPRQGFSEDLIQNTALYRRSGGPGRISSWSAPLGLGMRGLPSIST